MLREDQEESAARASSPRAPPAGMTVGQLCRQTGVSERALRYYEEFGLLSPRRLPTGYRVYSRREQVRLRLILKGRRVGLSLRQIRNLFDLFEKEGQHVQAAHALLLLRSQIGVLERKRYSIDDAIEVLGAASARLAAMPQAVPAEN